MSWRESFPKFCPSCGNQDLVVSPIRMGTTPLAHGFTVQCCLSGCCVEYDVYANYTDSDSLPTFEAAKECCIEPENITAPVPGYVVPE